MPRFLRRFLTLILVGIFTLFCASDYRHWLWLGQDQKTGDIYYYDARSLRGGKDGVFRVNIKMQRPHGKAVMEFYELDGPRKTMRNLTYNGPVIPILPGTPGDNLRGFLQAPH